MRVSTPGEGLSEALRKAGFRGELRPDEALAGYTTWRIGGPADVLAVPADRDDLALAIAWSTGADVPRRILGNGSNLLVRDEGVRGLVLRMRRVDAAVRLEGTRIQAGAGAMLPAVANLAAREGLAGLEFGAGIPGTIGGAIVMNAGWHQWEIRSAVSAVDVIDASGCLRSIPGDQCAFDYRTSRFRGGTDVVVGTTLDLAPDDPDELQARLDAFADSRKANQPTELPSCGSVFLKPQGDFAGRMIEQAGLKGIRVGDVQVSPKHANFFVNLGHATAADALALVERVEGEVFRRFGVRLTREFELW